MQDNISKDNISKKYYFKQFLFQLIIPTHVFEINHQ